MLLPLADKSVVCNGREDLDLMVVGTSIGSFLS